ncbi:alpha/beta hydrolase [Microlunatus parietis]|uniref:Acetyl esterase/lipase n=1 Tax=Microlunatus parietis TaxID=682979 RepID=A0A7Y9LEZ0_9ACTN|nr:alpha/beta hydrolase [Microlunatus parietis]NYE74323.1 acetyl esterase/lipase [Microlunatus parietis]
MTITTEDPNRAHWTALAAGQEPVWEDLGADPDSIETELTTDPAGRWLRPPDPLPGAAVLAIHGGGFIGGSTHTHRRLFGRLAEATGTATFAVEYGLVPEHVFPSQLDTVTAAYRRLLDRGATRVAVTGDSCGAGLAMALALRVRDEGLPAPAGVMLISAWVDLEATGDTYDTGSDPFFTRDLVRQLGAGYLAGTDPHHPLAAPIHADLRDLPPVYLQVGAAEAGLGDSRRLARRLLEAGVEVRLEEYGGQLHTFQMAAGRTRVADEAVGKAGRWLRSTLTRQVG